VNVSISLLPGPLDFSRTLTKDNSKNIVKLHEVEHPSLLAMKLFCACACACFEYLVFESCGVVVKNHAIEQIDKTRHVCL